MDKKWQFCLLLGLLLALHEGEVSLELVFKELNHLTAVLHVLYRGFDFYEVRKYYSKRKGKYFYTFNHFCSEKQEKSSKRAKEHSYIL